MAFVTMKIKHPILDSFLDTFGYRGVADLIEHTIPATGMKQITIISMCFAAITKVFGVPVELFFGLVFALMLEMITGTVVSIYYRNEKWSSKKFFRFFFKNMVLLVLLAAINLMKLGFEQMVEIDGYAFVESIVMFSLDSLFIFFLLSMSWYVILSVVENMAQTQNQFFVTMAKFLRIKISKLEEFASEK